MDKLLYAVNLEKYEPELARCLAELRDMGCDELVLAHISNTRRALQRIPTLLKDDVMRCVADASQEKLNEMARAARRQGMSVRTFTESADVAWIGICELAKREKPFLIVVGPVVGTDLGHTVYFLMHGTDTPLLIVKLPEEGGREPAEISCRALFRRILYPTDWSPTALEAQDFILRSKAMGVEEVVVLHTVEQDSIDQLDSKQQEEYRSQVQRQLETTRRIFEEAGLAAKVVTSEGPPASRINASAKRENASLIVMGSTGKSVSEETRLGSISERVARLTDRSLLLVYPTEQHRG